MTPIHLERREPAQNRLRFYNITGTRTLFDRWAVVREWGRIGQVGTCVNPGEPPNPPRTDYTASVAGESWAVFKQISSHPRRAGAM